MWNADKLADEHSGWVLIAFFAQGYAEKSGGYSGYASNNQRNMEADTKYKVVGQIPPSQR